jgi:hypothetical protein
VPPETIFPRNEGKRDSFLACSASILARGDGAYAGAFSGLPANNELLVPMGVIIDSALDNLFVFITREANDCIRPGSAQQHRAQYPPAQDPGGAHGGEEVAQALG